MANAWMQHVKKVKNQNKNLSLKQVLKLASKSYKKQRGGGNGDHKVTGSLNLKHSKLQSGGQGNATGGNNASSNNATGGNTATRGETKTGGGNNAASGNQTGGRRRRRRTQRRRRRR